MPFRRLSEAPADESRDRGNVARAPRDDPKETGREQITMKTNIPTGTLNVGRILEPWPAGWITLPMAAVAIGKSRSHVSALARAEMIKAKKIATVGSPGYMWAIDPSSLELTHGTAIPEYTSNQDCEHHRRRDHALELITIAEKLLELARVELER